MKKVVFGAMLFVGGAIMYSVGVLGFSDTTVQAQYMQIPKYAGMFSMVVGIIWVIVGLKKE